MNLRQKQNSIIYSAIAITVLSFVFLRFIPLQSRLEAANRLREDIRTAIAQASLPQQQLPQLEHKLEILKEIGINYQNNVPAKRALGGFLQKIASLMDEYSLSDQLLRPGKEIDTEKLNCIPVEMKCRGNLVRIFAFYGALQAMDRTMRIERVELTNDKKFDGRLAMYTKAVIYYKP